MQYNCRRRIVHQFLSSFVLSFPATDGQYGSKTALNVIPFLRMVWYGSETRVRARQRLTPSAHTNHPPLTWGVMYEAYRRAWEKAATRRKKKVYWDTRSIRETELALRWFASENQKTLDAGSFENVNDLYYFTTLSRDMLRFNPIRFTKIPKKLWLLSPLLPTPQAPRRPQPIIPPLNQPHQEARQLIPHRRPDPFTPSNRHHLRLAPVFFKYPLFSDRGFIRRRRGSRSRGQ